MPAEYTVISHADFAKFIEESGYGVTGHGGYEYVYEKTIHRRVFKMGGFSTVVRVFSSVDIRSDTTREKGKDAIRVVPLLIPGEHMINGWQHVLNYPKLRDSYPLRKLRRVHRVTNWQANLASRLKLAEEFDITKSPAGWPMILRTGSNGRFWASLGYPMEKFTQPYQD